MTSIIILAIFSTVVLLFPPPSVKILLDLMDIDTSAKLTLLFVVVLNVVASSLLERWELVAKVVDWVRKRLRSRRPRRVRDGKLYKAVEGAMN